MNILLKIAPLIRYREIRILVYTLTNGKPVFSLFRATRKKGQVNIESLIDRSSEKDLLFDEHYYSPEIPLILSLQGEGLVQRIYSGKPADLNKQIPNIDLKEYFSQYHTLDSERTFVALLRKDKLDAVLSQFRDQNIYIGNVFLGYAGFLEFLPSLELKVAKIHAGIHILELDQTRVISVGKSSDNEKPELQEDQIKAEGCESVALGVAVHWFVHPFNKQEERSFIQPDHLKELTAAKLNRWILRYCFPALLGILLINFLLFNQLQQNLESVELTRSDKKKIALHIDRLKKEIGAEKELAVKVNMRGDHVFAYYIDHLAALNVPGIRFEELSVDPVHSKIKANEMIGFSRGSIVIKGVADQSESFGDLLVRLNAANWIGKISRQVYVFDNDSHAAKFEVVLDYKKVGSK